MKRVASRPCAAENTPERTHGKRIAPVPPSALKPLHPDCVRLEQTAVQSLPSCCFVGGTALTAASLLGR